MLLNPYGTQTWPYTECREERVPCARKHALKMLKGNAECVIGGLRVFMSQEKLKDS